MARGSQLQGPRAPPLVLEVTGDPWWAFARTAGLAGLRKVGGPGGHGVYRPGQPGGGRLGCPQPLQALVQVLCPEATAPRVFPRNAVTQYPGPGGLNHSNLSHGLEARI